LTIFSLIKTPSWLQRAAAPDWLAVDERETALYAELREQHLTASLLGIADDGLPVLLHLRNPRPGPILICGDAQPLLQQLARSTLAINAAFGVIVLTNDVQRWQANERMSVCNQTTPLPSLVDLVEARTRETFGLLLIDGYEMVQADEPRFLYLCQHGPAGGIWPILAESEQAVTPGLFLTLIHGRSKKFPQLRTGEYLMSKRDGSYLNFKTFA
jgi:hypothetical protein